MKIFSKIFLSFIAVIVLFVTLSGFLLTQTTNIKNNGAKIYSQGVAPSNVLIKLGQLTENTRVQMVTALAFKNTDATQAALANLDTITELESQLDAMELSPQKQQLLQSFTDKWALFDERVRINEQLMTSGQWEEANEGIKIGKPLFEESMLVFDELSTLNAEEGSTLASDNDKAFKTTVTIILVAIVILTIIALLIAYTFSHSIRKRLNSLATHTEQLAQGDLSVPLLELKGTDEITDTAHSLNEMQVAFAKVVTEAHDTSQQLSASAEEMSATTVENMSAAESIASMSQQSVENASMQQQSVNHITTSLHDMNDNVNRILENGLQLQQLSNDTFDKTKQGAQTVENVNIQIQSIAESAVETGQAVKNLNDKSLQIGNIINMITQIADQTNLLALNAAIEAARAGESGKGFAVVADEVRNLAEQSRHSAETIQQMINEIQLDISNVITSIEQESERVEVGLQKSQEVQTVFSEIETMVENVTSNSADIHTAIAAISTLGQSISSKTEEVNHLAQHSFEAAQTNNTSSETQLGAIEEITAASESLASLSVQLQSVISQFKL